MKIINHDHTSHIIDEIISQAQREAPCEACGYLLGISTEDEGNVVAENYPMENADHSPEHFSFVPREQFAALKYARSRGLRILANWHSHPASPSRPSEEDLRLALDPTRLREVIESSIIYRIRIHQRDLYGRHTSWHHGHS